MCLHKFIHILLLKSDAQLKQKKSDKKSNHPNLLGKKNHVKRKNKNKKIKKERKREKIKIKLNYGSFVNKPYCDHLDYTYSCVYVSKTAFFFFFFFVVQPQQLTLSTVNSASVHCSRSHKLHFSAIFLLKMDPTALFTHLKIISLQCFQFQFSVSAKISLIQTHPLPRSFKEASFFTLKPSAQTKKQKTTKAKVQRRRETVEKKALLLLCYWFFFFFSWKNLKNKNAQVSILGELLALSFSLRGWVCFLSLSISISISISVSVSIFFQTYFFIIVTYLKLECAPFSFNLRMVFKPFVI